MSSLSHFILNSDYPIEMITYYHQYDDLVKAGQQTYKKVIPHTLGYTPLVFGVWSNTPDFSKTQSIGSGNILNSPYIYAYKDRIEVRIAGIPGYPIVSADKKYYFRIYAFAPDDFFGLSATTQESSKPLVVNTDYAYSHKLASITIQPGNYEDGSDEKVEEIDTTRGFVQKEVIASHVDIACDPLIRPTCMAWTDVGDGNGLWQNYMNDYDYYRGAIGIANITPTVFMDGNKISILSKAQDIAEAKKAKIYVRVYADG